MYLCDTCTECSLDTRSATDYFFYLSSVVYTTVLTVSCQHRALSARQEESHFPLFVSFPSLLNGPFPLVGRCASLLG